MKLFLPDKRLLKKTGEVDYYDWYYKFPIKYVLQYRLKKIVHLLGKKKYPVLLEAGTGSGIFLPELSKHCEYLYACDIHNDFDNITAMLEEYGIKNYNLSTQSIDQTNFSNESFDAVVAVSMLEFVPDIQKALSEIKRILKKEGIFITVCPMESAILDFFLSFYTRKPPHAEFGDARQKVSKLLEDNFILIKKGYMVPLIGKFFPVYTYYKLKKNG